MLHARQRLGMARYGTQQCIAVVQLQADALVTADAALAARAAGLVDVVPFECLFSDADAEGGVSVGDE